MENLVEKSLKRCLKRKFKITLGLITAFLIMGISALSDDAVLNITQGAGEEILFNGKVFDEENHEFIGNTFENNNIYTNKNYLYKTVENDSNLIEIVGLNKDFTFVNENFLNLNSRKEESSIIGIVADIKTGNMFIKNKGIISTKTGYYLDYSLGIANTNTGIYILNNSSNKADITNNGIIKTYGGYQGQAIYLYGSIGEIKNTGILSSITKFNEDNQSFTIGTHQDTENPRIYTKIDVIKNNGIINSKGYIIAGIRLDMNETQNIENNGKIIAFGDGASYGIEIQDGETKKIFNNGILGTISNGTGQAIRVANTSVNNFENDGVTFSIGGTSNYETVDSSIENINNKGVIIKNTKDLDGVGVGLYNKINNYGIISADIPIEYYDNNKINNNGLFINEEGYLVSYNENSKKFITQESDKNKNESNIKNEEIGKIIINAGSDENGYVQSISSDAIKDLSEDKGYILNGYDKTVVINSATGDKNINSSVINAVKNAVSFDGKDLTLGLKDTIVNGGYGEDIVSGDGNRNTLNLSGETIINGNVNLGAGSDVLSLDDTVQINGILNGGEDNDKDILTFNSSKNNEVLSESGTAAENNNINVLHDIKNFDEANISTDVTLFEKTVDENGNIKTLEAQLGDIAIGENGNLNLRIDGTEKDEESGNVIGHALYGNNGSITSNGGKLNLKTFGFGEEEVVDFKDTDLSGLKEEDITISSALHEGKLNGNSIEVSAKKDLEDLDISNYNKLNKIYHSILNSQNVDKFTVEEEQYKDFVNYISDIYTASPYAYSSELSRKSMNMFKDTALSKDLKPELNNWVIFGGFTHIDGGTKESYYGKGYYTYDIGSKDIDADTKITGAYMQAEYGKSETLTTGILFGGNNAETELSTGTTEGDLFYFGAYAKKFVNDFRFTLGAGFQHGDYKADRTALGYNGITETRKYSENYHDRGFNIYGDVKYSKEIIKDLFIEPYFNIEYSYIDQDGADENGVLALETDSKNFNYTTGKVGVDVKKIIPMEKTKHIFTAGISYENILSGADEEYITGRFKNGTDFDILVAEKNDDVFSINAKYELEFENGMMFELKGIYSFEHNDMEDEWTAGIGIGYRF